MAWIREIPDDEATGLLKEQYDGGAAAERGASSTSCAS